MAGETFSTISTVLSQIYTARLADARNMASFELNALNIVPNDSGKNLAWVAKFDGTRDVTNFADDGVAVQAAEYTKTTKVPATLAFGNYRAPAMITDLAGMLASVSTGSPTELMSLVDHEVKDSLVQITKQVAIDFYVGDGTSTVGSNPNIVGLTGGAALQTGTYAGIDRATYTQWAAHEIANGAVEWSPDLARVAALAESPRTSSSPRRTCIGSTPISSAAFSACRPLALSLSSSGWARTTSCGAECLFTGRRGRRPRSCSCSIPMMWSWCSRRIWSRTRATRRIRW